MTMDLEYLICNTDFLGFLTRTEIACVRISCQQLKDCITSREYPFSWIQKCRMYDPDMLWDIDGRRSSCYKPTNEMWSTVRLPHKIPSVVPDGFWRCYLRWIKSYMTLTKIQEWSMFVQKPIVWSDGKETWEIGMRMDIVGNSIHNSAFYPEELKDIDEFLSVGVSFSHMTHIHDSIVGLNSFSIGWHSDDGNIYMDCLVVGCFVRFGKGDRIEVIVDYREGIVIFKKNNVFVFTYELMGEFLNHPLILSATCKTKNTLFFQLV